MLEVLKIGCQDNYALLWQIVGSAPKDTKNFKDLRKGRTTLEGKGKKEKKEKKNVFILKAKGQMGRERAPIF